MLFEEFVVQHLAGVPVLLLQECLLHSLEKCHVPIDANLKVLLGEGGGHSQHAAGLLRVCEREQAGLLERVDRHDSASLAPGGLQGAEHAGMIGAGVLAEDKDCLRLFKVIQGYRALADAQRWLEGGPTGLVAHVGAVRQVVGAVLACKKLIEVGGFIDRPTGCVKDCLVRRVEGVQFLCDQGEGLIPSNGFIMGSPLA